MRTQSEIKLAPLNQEEGSALLLQYLPQVDSSQDSQVDLAKAISREVDGLPLLLVGLGGFMSQSYTSMPEVLQTLKHSRFSN